jgi:hypothetical protein
MKDLDIIFRLTHPNTAKVLSREINYLRNAKGVPAESLNPLKWVKKLPSKLTLQEGVQRPLAKFSYEQVL